MSPRVSRQAYSGRDPVRGTNGRMANAYRKFCHHLLLHPFRLILILHRSILNDHNPKLARQIQCSHVHRLFRSRSQSALCRDAATSPDRKNRYHLVPRRDCRRSAPRTNPSCNDNGTPGRTRTTRRSDSFGCAKASAPRRCASTGRAGSLSRRAVGVERIARIYISRLQPILFDKQSPRA